MIRGGARHGTGCDTFEGFGAGAALSRGQGCDGGAGNQRFIILVIDGAGWHREPGLEAPGGLRLVYLPRYSPQLQPAECLWSVRDEPIANTYFETIEQFDAVFAERCRALDTSPDLFKRLANFRWWPKTHRPIRSTGFGITMPCNLLGLLGLLGRL